MSVRTYEQISDLPTGITPVTGAELVELEQDGVSRKFTMTELGGITAEHQGTHQFGSTDPVGTHEKVANGIPYLNSSGLIDDHVSDASETVAGKVELASDGESAAGKAVQSDDGRLSDARTPTGHATSHYGVGADLIPDATTEASGLMSNGDKTKLDNYLPTADEKAALAGSYGTPSAVNRFITESDPVLSSIGGGGITSTDLLGIGQIGDGLTIASAISPAIASLNSTDVAYIDNYNDQLRTYTFNGAAWAQKGNSLSVASVGDPALASLNSTDVAFIDNTNDELRCYTFNGTDWAQKGNSLSVAGIGTPAIATLNSTDVAFIDYTNDELRCYTFNGTDWAQKGNSLSISTVANAALAALNSTDVAFLDDAGQQLRTYTFDGTNWTQKGNSLSILVSAPALASLNSTDVVLYDDVYDTLSCYTFNGIEWVKKGNSLTIDGSGFAKTALAALNSTDVAFYHSINRELRTYNFLFGYDSASVNISADYTVPELSNNKSLLIRRLAAYDGNAITITPPSGATFEGLSDYRLYEQYASVTIERVSATLFAIVGEGIQKITEVGKIEAFCRTLPKGFKACDGSAISRATFPALFSAIGTTFGAGDGSTTFNLPDLRETVLVGTGTRGAGVTAHDTYTLGQFKDDQMQGHDHGSIPTLGIAGAPASGSGYLTVIGSNGTSNPTVTDGVNGTPRTGSTTHGKQIGVNYAIRYA